MTIEIKDGKVVELLVPCNFTVKTDSFSNDVTSVSTVVDFKGAPESIVSTMLRKSVTIEVQKKRKLGASKVFAMFNGKTVNYAEALAGVRTVNIDPEQAKSITIRTYKGLVAEGKFEEAEEFLFEITGTHSAAWLDAHPEYEDPEDEDEIEDADELNKE